MAVLLAAAADAAQAALELERIGESVLVIAPDAGTWPAPFCACTGVADLEAAWEAGRIAAAAELPGGLDGAEFTRALLLAADPARLSPEEAALLTALRARGCEEVEIVPLAAGADLGQSWTSGRRLSAAG